VRNILGSIAYTSQFTRGRIAGLPWTLRIVHRPNVTGPDGTQRQVPLWAITTQPPSGVSLSSRTFRDLATQALREGRQLMLPTPATPTLEELEADGPPDEIEVDEPSEEQMLALQSGSKADQAHWTRTWHAMARGITWQHDGKAWDLASDEGRAAFIYEHSGHKTGSLSAFLQTATEDGAAELIAALGSARTQMQARKYDAIFAEPSEKPVGQPSGAAGTEPATSTEGPPAAF
jgi:hypothetical protein